VGRSAVNRGRRTLASAVVQSWLGSRSPVVLARRAAPGGLCRRLVPASRLWPVDAREPLVHFGLSLLTRKEKVRTVIGAGNPGPPPLTLRWGRTSLDGNRGCLLSIGANLGSLTSTATLTLPALALSLPVGFSHVFLHVLGLAGSLVPRPGNNGNGGSGVNSGRCSLWARALDSA
jgi:hypothetical protein